MLRLNCFFKNYAFGAAVFLPVMLSPQFAFSNPAATDERQDLQAWGRSLESGAYQNCLFTAIGEVVDVDGIVTFRKDTDIVRRGEWLRLSTENTNAVGLTEVYTEICVTDQLLRLQGRASPARQIALSASGYMDSWDKLAEESLALGEFNLLLGRLYMPNEGDPHIPDLIARAAQQGNKRTVQLKGGGSLTAEFTESQVLPTSITHSFFYWRYADGHFDRHKRESSRVSWNYTKLKWATHHGIPYIQEFVYDIPGVTKRPTHYRITLVKLGASLSDVDFLPTLPIAEGTSVSVADVPVECEWRENRIKPVLPAGTSSIGLFAFASTPLSRFVIILFPAFLAIAIYAMYRRAGKAS